MTFREKIVVLLGIGMFLLLLLFPPWRFETKAVDGGQHVEFDELVGHRFIFTPPEPKGLKLVFTTTHIDGERLAVLALIILVLDGTALWLVRTARKTKLDV